MEKRNRFSSRLGFILISAGCAIGLGNVWRFPYVTAKYGGGAFVLLYLLFLLVMGIPIVVMEFSVGRASQKSIARSYEALEPKGSKWHIHKYFGIAGNVLLMMYYTTIGGWLISYVVKFLRGDFEKKYAPNTQEIFNNLKGNRNEMILWMVVISVVALLVCSLGFAKGVESITKWMMVSLLGLMLVLLVRSLSLPKAMEGIAFYLKPDFKKMFENDFGEVIFAAMGQAFFTLSCGIGSLAIFGSYIGKERTLTGEAISVTCLDTMVALLAGLIIFPATESFGVNIKEAGQGLLFVALPEVFVDMKGGRIWGACFFIFMTFAGLSTIIAVFQNILACMQELCGWSLKKATCIVGPVLIALSMPCILGFTDWKNVKILGMGIDGFEDFLVSNNLLPLGALVYLLFCVSKYGWGWKKFIAEANAGKGIKFPVGKAARIYLTFILPVAVLYIFVQGYISMFRG